MVRVVIGLGLVILPSLFLTTTAAGQTPAQLPHWEIPGFDFSRDGVWRVRAREIARARAAARARALEGDAQAAILPAGPDGPGGAWTGTFTIPVLLGRPINPTLPGTATQIASKLFGSSTYPISLTTYYLQQSHGQMTVNGQVYGWFALPNDTAWYTGVNGCGGGVICSDGTAHLADYVLQTLQAADPSVDFAQFDNDGPDNVPNSGDDDGYVDLAALLHPQIGGECQGPPIPGNPSTGYRHLWSHRFHVRFLTGSDFVTNDPSNRAGFGNIRVGDYFLTGAEGGGDFGCTAGALMQVGIFAHEFGHGLGLPDFYDTSGETQGLGYWGLMATGNYNRAPSPAFMEGFSRGELGWVAEVPLSTPGVYTLSPTETRDTVYLVNTSTAGEYFILENRQPIESDSFVAAPGLTIYHVDRTLYDQRRGTNSVNNGSIHAVALLEADGLRQLWCESNGCNRGDGGDIYPGTSGNRRLSFRTNPAALKNNGTFAGFAIDSIKQVSTNGPVTFRLRFGALSVVRASDTAAVIQFEGASFNVYRDLLEEGGSYTVSVADTQIAANGRTRWRFVSWSDGGAMSHTITGDVDGDTIVANLARDFKLIATATSGGSVSANISGDLAAGVFVPEDQAVELTATPDPDETFNGWSGDTTATALTITLPMGRPFTVTAVFGDFAIASVSTRPAAIMGAAYADTLEVVGGTGTNSWSVTGGALPLGLALNSSTGEISGYPRETGNFTFQVTVTSGSLSESQTFTISVTAPVLATADVVAHLLGPSAPLNADQLRYLDFLGNNNDVFDIGDFLAWVKATGAP